MKGTYPLGTRMRKKSGSSWQGRVVGYYATTLTPVGYCIESEREPGSVQIYPAGALEAVNDLDHRSSIFDSAPEKVSITCGTCNGTGKVKRMGGIFHAKIPERCDRCAGTGTVLVTAPPKKP